MPVARRRYLTPILDALAGGPATYNQLLKELRLYPDTLNRAVRDLKGAEIVEIVQETRAGRERTVYRLTSKGRLFHRKFKEVQRQLRELDEMLKTP